MNVLGKIDVSIYGYELTVSSSDGNKHEVQITVTDKNSDDIVCNNGEVLFKKDCTVGTDAETILLDETISGTCIIAFIIEGDRVLTELNISDIGLASSLEPFDCGVIAVISGLYENNTVHRTTFTAPSTGGTDVIIFFQDVETNRIVLPPHSVILEHRTTTNINVDISTLVSGQTYKVLYNKRVKANSNESPAFTKP